MEKNVCIVNFNTPELVRACILSLWKNTPDAKVTVFDNSNLTPCFEMDGVRVIDNTKEQILSFVDLLARHPNRLVDDVCHHGTAKHSYTIQKLWEYYPEGFLLLDSDILIKRDVTPLFDTSVAYIGEYECYKERTPRILPMICWLNVPMLLSNGIKYFDESKSHKLNPVKDKLKEFYDTGASFLMECTAKKVPCRLIYMDEYIIHLGGGSYKGKPWQKWLEEHKDLYL